MLFGHGILRATEKETGMISELKCSQSSRLSRLSVLREKVEPTTRRSKYHKSIKLPVEHSTLDFKRSGFCPKLLILAYTCQSSGGSPILITIITFFFKFCEFLLPGFCLVTSREKSSCSLLTSVVALTLPSLSRWFWNEDDVLGRGGRSSLTLSGSLGFVTDRKQALPLGKHAPLLGHFFFLLRCRWHAKTAADGQRSGRARDCESVWCWTSNCAIRALTCVCDPWSFGFRQWSQFSFRCEAATQALLPCLGLTSPLNN